MAALCLLAVICGAALSDLFRVVGGQEEPGDCERRGTWLPGDSFRVYLLTLFICKMGTQTQRVYVLH